MQALPAGDGHHAGALQRMRKRVSQETRTLMQTEAQILLAVHLAELGIKTVPEYRFDPERQFRFDLADLEHRIGFECNGHWQGKHGAGWSEGAEKINLAQMQGWKVLVFHNRDVLTGRAKQFIAEHLK